MKRKLLLGALLCGVSLTLLSCQEDKTKDGPKQIQPGDLTKIQLTVEASDYNVNGVATNNDVKKLDGWLLVFDAVGKNIQADKLTAVNVGEKFSHEVAAGPEMRFVVVGNAPDVTFTKGFTYDEFVNMDYTGTMAAESDIPLVGQITATVDKEGQVLDAISVSRIASVVSFKISQQKSDLGLKTFQLKNVPAKAYFISKGDNSSLQPDQFTDFAAVNADGEVHTYVVPENLSGTLAGIASAKDKITDKKALCVEVVAGKDDETGKIDARFVYFYGENATTDFNVKRNSVYNAEIAIDFSDTSDKRIESTFIPPTVKAGLANCYMLQPDYDKYFGIPVARANEFWDTAEGGRTKANVIVNAAADNEGKVTKWVAKVMKSYPEDGLIEIVNGEGTDAEGYIAVVPKGKPGNVVIGLYDATAGEPAADAPVLWSWHVWLTDYNPGGGINGDRPEIAEEIGQAEVAGGKVFRMKKMGFTKPENGAQPGMMDRNLGAMSASHADGLKTVGAFYQHGRKDPFFFDLTTDGEKVKPIEETIDKQTAVQKPDEFHSKSGSSWLTTNDKKLWDNGAKTIYDPCPEGWRIPDGSSFLDGNGEEDTSTTAAKGDGPFNGLILYAKEGLDAYFPLCGQISMYGMVSGLDGQTYLWNGAEHAAATGKTTRLTNPDTVDWYESFYAVMTGTGSNKGGACQVRCVKE